MEPKLMTVTLQINTHGSGRSRNGGEVRMIRSIMVLMAGMLFTGTALAVPAQIRMADLDGDGYKEAEMYYAGGQIVKTLADFDRNSYKETVIYYKDGRRDHAEQYFTRDGMVDRWIYYYAGVPWKVAEDLNRDGKADYWFYLKDGRVYRWEQDRNHDGKVDVRTVYEFSKSGKRTLARQSYDDDSDGIFEQLSGITAAKGPPAIPHSLAEVLLR